MTNQIKKTDANKLSEITEKGTNQIKETAQFLKTVNTLKKRVNTIKKMDKSEQQTCTYNFGQYYKNC